MFKAEWEKLAAKAQETGANTDPVLRDRLASTYIEVEIMRYLGMGTLTRFLGGAQPGPAESAFKLYWSEYHKRLTELALDVIGPDAMIAEPSAKKAFHSDAPGSPNDPVHGSERSTTPVPARSTPAPARSSATSSARWCWVCPRNPSRRPRPPRVQ